MATDQTTLPISSSNAQDFTGSDDEIMDNFAEGPQPGDPPPSGDTHDDGTPLGLGGEKGKQSEPASSTLESDLTIAQPGEENPPEVSAPSDPVQDAGEVVEEEIPSADSEEPEVPDLPPTLLKMAGYPDAAAAQADGLGTPEALTAFVRGRSQLLTSELSGPSESPASPYSRPTAKAPPAATPMPAAPETVVETDSVTPFELPADRIDHLDDDLQDVLRGMNEHYQRQDAARQKELEALRSSVGQREEESARQQQEAELKQFDQAIQGLGENWQDVFGEGSGEELAKNGQRDPVAMTNLNHRALLLETVQTIRDVNAQVGTAPLDLEQQIQFALMQRYPDKFQQSISGNSKRTGPSRGISRPTQRRTPPKSQNDKTMAAVNAMLAKRGRAQLTAGSEEEFEGEI